MNVLRHPSCMFDEEGKQARGSKRKRGQQRDWEHGVSRLQFTCTLFALFTTQKKSIRLEGYPEHTELG